MDLPYEQTILFTHNKTGLAGTIYKSHGVTAINIKMNERKDYTQSLFLPCSLKKKAIITSTLNGILKI